VSDELGLALLHIARGAIAERLGLPAQPAPDLPELEQPAATFVTLTSEGALRGCIGSLEPRLPLREDVRNNALAAAFRDPRFPPLGLEEFGAARVEVSLLGALEPIAVIDETDALRRLRPGIDGVVLTCGGHRATFLPQVWESLPDPRHFLAQLKRKAGLAAGFWNEDLRLARYQVTKWKETLSART
jgi:hypothetical protein